MSALASVEEVCELTPLQQGMLFHTQYSPESSVYTLQLECLLEGEIDCLVLEHAWRILVGRYAPLRTSFVWNRVAKPYQLVHLEVDSGIKIHDWSVLSPAEQEGNRLIFLAEDRAALFDLAKPPLQRIALIVLGVRRFRLVWTFHHIILEAWSAAVVMKELWKIYGDLLMNRVPDLPQVPRYTNYVRWMQSQDQRNAEAYWRDTFKGFHAPTRLPIDRSSVSALATVEKVDACKVTLSKGFTDELKGLSRASRVTLNTVFQGAWSILLSRYSGDSDVVFGAVVSGRPADLPDAEITVGLFVNTLPARVKVSVDASLSGWLRDVQLNQATMRQYEFSSLMQVRAWSDVPGGQPLFHTAIGFQNWLGDLPSGHIGTDLQVLEREMHGASDQPLTMFVGMGDELKLVLMYDVERFERVAVQRMLGHLQMLLEGMVARPQAKLGELAILTEAERDQVMVKWNQTGADYPRDCSIKELFEEQVARSPEAVAVEFNGQRLSYAQLNARANQLAHYLRAQGVGPEVMVGICVERSLEMVVGTLGILKAGGAYVPLDPKYPGPRLAMMLEDTAAPVLLSEAGLRDRLPAFAGKVVCLDAHWPEIARQPQANPQVEVGGSNLAYVMYTSGSTGRPKGTCIEQRSVVRLVKNTNYIELGPKEVFLQYSPISFDASTLELWGSLLNGAKLLVCPAGQLSMEELGKVIREGGVSTLWLTAGLFNLMVNEQLESLRGVRQLLAGGEALSVAHVRRVLEVIGKGRLINGYGPTENTTFTCCHVMDAQSRIGQSVPIGRPISNTRVYILDERRQPVPVGVAGELYLGGDGLARGYLNQPELTAEKFVADPFSKQAGARLYRTGDWVRYLPDGNIEFIGRRDNQVKVRGFRIELGEIEAALGRFSAVQEAVVLVREDQPGDKRVVAYVVPKAGQGEGLGDLRNELKGHLPEYMVPAHFVTLDALPLTPNGKVDRKALPAPDASEQMKAAYVAPRTPTEEILAGIWAEVLRIGVEDNFFELGGHSLLATQVISRARGALGVELPLRELFSFPTIAGLSLRIEALRAGAGSAVMAPPLIASGQSGPAELSFSQSRLWLLDQIEPGSAAYIMAGAFELRGALDVPVLERALAALVERHEALRTVFVSAEGQAQQVVKAPQEWTLPFEDLREEELQARLREEASRGFDLARGPLFRAQLYRLSAQTHVLLLTMHHIISDGWSLGIMMRELSELYRGFSRGEPIRLAALRVQYRDFARWQRDWLQGEVLETQLAHWRERLGGAPQVLELPTDRARPAVESHRGAIHSFTLPRELADGLRALSRREGATLFMTLLSGFALLLSRYSGQEDLLVGTPVANRNRSEIEGLVGFFVNTLVLRAEVSGKLSVREFIAHMREVCLDAFAHQDLPFDRLVEELHPVRDMSRNPVFQVLFALQNAPMQPLELPGLTLSPVELHGTTAKVDLTLFTWETPEGLTGAFEYATDFFDASTIARMAGHLRTLLEAMVAAPAHQVSDLALLSDAERDQVMVKWNQTGADYPRDCSIKELFEEQVARSPEAVAVEFNGQRLSYRELDERANRLARHLRTLGVGAEVMVGLCFERSVEMVVGLLGILKAGGAYVPLDPAYPADRLAFMLEDTGAPVVLSVSALLPVLPESGARIVCLDRDWPTIAAQSAQAMDNEVNAQSLAYVIYTSGSTGTPKGVRVTHRSITRLVRNTDYIDIRPEDRFAQVSVISFDAATFEVWGALLNGAQIVVVAREVSLSPREFGEFLKQHAITVMFLTTALFNQMAREAPGALRSLRYMLFGGEAVDAGAVRSVLRDGRPEHLLHVYGPTEVTTFSTWYPVSEVGEAATTVPIGRPIANTTAYVLDGQLKPVPVGVPGELYLGGDGVASGYHQRAELTAEKFVADPFSKQAGARLYRTGDWVRYLPDGNIEFIGRRDNQVKVRGFRIELGEIEAALGRFSAVQEAVVLVREDQPGDKRVVAYVVPKAGQGEGLGDLRNELKGHLPEYMVPAHFVTLDALPLTPNGKVDRKALPAPDASEQMKAAYVAPRTPTEEILAGIWAEVLRIERVGVEDNFFELGGHSLLATQVISRARGALGVELPLRELFSFPTIAGLSLRIEALRAEPRPERTIDTLMWQASTGRSASVTGKREEFEL